MNVMNEQSMRFRIGVFVLAAIILLAVLIMLFGGMPTLFKTYDRYTIWFETAPGVNPGTPVRRSGVRIGQVESVQLDETTGRVRVHIAIDKGHSLYEDDQPVLVKGVIGNDVSIDFVQRPPEREEKKPPEAEPPRVIGQPGKIKQVAFEVAQAQPNQGNQPPSRKRVPPGAEFQGANQADVPSTLKELSRVLPPAEAAFKEMQRTLERYERMTPLMEETLREYRDLARASRDAVPELRATNQEVQGLVKSVRETVPELRATNQEVQGLAKALRDTVPEMRRTNAEIQAAARNWGDLGERLDLLLKSNQDKLVKTLDELQETLHRISNVFNDQNQRNLTETLQNVRNGSKNLESISKNTESLVKESRTTVERVNDAVTRADQVMTNLQQATKPFADRSDSITKNLDEGTARLNKTMAQVQELMRTLGQDDGTLRRLLADPALYNNLNDAACMLARIMPRLDRVLKDIEVFADKIARHPESLGVGGAIRPSSGLKEAPSNGMEWHPPGH